jgi:outer membrane immunogenic protein
MNRILLASVAAISLATGAAAADLPRYGAPAPGYVGAPLYLWTGFYAGLNAGYGWGSSNWDGVPTGDFDASGPVVGGQIGFNYQYRQAVFGVEGDLNWSDIKGATTVPGCTPAFPCATANDWLSTVRGRVGYAFDRLMPYATAGAAFGNVKATSPGFVGTDTTQTGWSAGVGLEVGIVGNVTAKAEFLHVDLGGAPCALACGLPAGNNVDFSANLLRGGVNVRF